MRCSVSLLFCAALIGCRRESPPAPPPLVPQTSGTIVVGGLSAPVRVVRDRWGVPHIYANSAADLFTAQGFVQAQDRLFQMDLWRRSSQGRLAQILGPNFIERDAMTRNVQYQGPLAEEWASYGGDARGIAEAFVRGINAWVALARAQPPEEFALARWLPEFWTAADVLNRTEAFLASGDAIDEVRRRRLNDVVADAVRRVGTAPFFATQYLIDPQQTASRVGTSVNVGERLLSAAESPLRLETPSPRYLVHLKAPGWNVIGATSPWRPGVAFGHNERIAWALAPVSLDTQDVFVEPDDGPRSIVQESIAVKGRQQPFLFDRVTMPNGIVVASDQAHRAVFTVRWSGTEAGAAPELASLLVDRAVDWRGFREALTRWKMPARRTWYADADGNVGFQDAAVVPRRQGSEWRGWLALDQLPHAFNPRRANSPAVEPPRARTADTATFPHVLGSVNASRQRFDVGPVPRADDDAQVRIVMNARDWDRSTAMNAPGQSGSPDSAHYKDLIGLWSTARRFQLAFSDAAVEGAMQAVLTLVPK